MSDSNIHSRREFFTKATVSIGAISLFPSCSSLKDAKPMTKPILIAHRGASGYRPEHTLESYKVAIEMGCDFIEPDLVLTKDGQLICRHENNITETTNVAYFAEFSDRKTTKIIDGETQTGWFTEDFTLAEIKKLRCVERLPKLRPKNKEFNGVFEIPTFFEVLELRQRYSNIAGREIGIYPETKHPSYFATKDLYFDEELVSLLKKFGVEGYDAPVFIQSFEVENLKLLAKKTSTRLIQLMSKDGGPWDSQEKISQTYASMYDEAGLNEIAKYAYGVGPEKALIIEADNEKFKITDFVKNAHKNNLKVHPWTFRAENYFMIDAFKTSKNIEDSASQGDLKSEIKAFLNAGIDGLFSDNSDIARAAIEEFVNSH